jgi:hypothetical protein
MVDAHDDVALPLVVADEDRSLVGGVEQVSRPFDHFLGGDDGHRVSNPSKSSMILEVTTISATPLSSSARHVWTT